MAYVLIQERRTPEQRAEVDEMLDGAAKVGERRQRAAVVSALGGDVRGAAAPE